ncbi:MAG: nucleotidyl transferase AbiEii/AbiGii toxin family protein [Lacisediminihabitans sp.]
MAFTEAQRAVTRSGLAASREFGFALAGSGALIEHGIVSRPSDDADWFSTVEHAESFDAAIAAVTSRLEADGFVVTPIRQEGTFFQFEARTTTGEVVEVDMSLDWRRYNPAEISIGPVLDIQDAAAAKVGTIYSRGEARDFIDLWFIRKSELWTDTELFAMAHDRDEGIDVTQFLAGLKAADKYGDAAFVRYGLSSGEIDDVRKSTRDFGTSISPLDLAEIALPDHSGDVHVRSHNRDGSGVRHYWRSRPTRS